jgi:hypothetical protein
MKMAPRHRVDTEWLAAIERLRQGYDERGRVYNLPPLVSIDMINQWSARGAAGAFDLVAMEMTRIGGDSRLTPANRTAVQAAFRQLAKRLTRSAMFERAERAELYS